MAKQRKPIRDTKTGKQYPSMYEAGKDLAGLVGGDASNRFVWFEIQRKFRGRFETKDENGNWVPLSNGKSKTTEQGAQVGKEIWRTTLDVDPAKVAKVKELLGTRTLRETVDRALEEVIKTRARLELIAWLKTLDPEEVERALEEAWRD